MYVNCGITEITFACSRSVGTGISSETCEKPSFSGLGNFSLLPWAGAAFESSGLADPGPTDAFLYWWDRWSFFVCVHSKTKPRKKNCSYTYYDPIVKFCAVTPSDRGGAL